MLSTTNWHLPSASTETSLMAQWSGILLWCKSHRFHPWVRKIPWRRERQPTCIFSPGKPQEQRSLAGYSPWGRESQTRLSGQQHTPTSRRVKSYAFAAAAFHSPWKAFVSEIRNEAICALGETGRTGLQILHIFRSWFYEPSSCISSYLKKYQNSSWWWLLPMTSRNLLQKNICLTARILLSPKSHIYWLYPYFFEAVSQSYLRYCLLGYSPHCAPNKT